MNSTTSSATPSATPFTASPAAATIDVRSIPPRERHPRIFATFRGLQLGAALELVNDHDPAPLRAQFEMQTPGQYGWNYLERGPAVWRVRITRLGDAPSSDGNCCGGCTCGG